VGPGRRPGASAGPRWRIDAAAAGLRLDAWFARQPVVGSRARASEWIDRGKVFLNDRELTRRDAGRRLRAGDTVDLWVDRPGTAQAPRRGVSAARRTLRIVFEDAALLVADKPAGVLVEPLPGEEGAEITLLDLVEDHLRTDVRAHALLVHRIDRDTTGLVLFAKTQTAWADLKRQFASHSPERTYLALLEGEPQPAAGVWRDRLVWDGGELRQRRAPPTEARGREAVARYRVLEQFPDIALVEIRLETGKRNQIRVQAGMRGHPLVGEKMYTFRPPRDPSRGHQFPRQALHAARLGFQHPAHGTRLVVNSPLPGDIREMLDRLRG
jgi:23S rRNA pseudouridine1911/1915/1917 synthase